jgi:hypothetical protein
VLVNPEDEADYLGVRPRSGLRLVVVSGVAAIALAGLVASVGVAAADAHARGVTITSLPRHANEGGLEHLNATVSGPVKCSLAVSYATGKTQALGRKRVLAHRVAWTWRVPARTAGRATARVSCGGLVRVGKFTVTPHPPATVAVTDSGFTQVPNGYDSGTTISYGLVLVNRSHDEDASLNEVHVTLVDAAGNAVGTDIQYIVGTIRAGTTFYAGGFTGTNDSTVISHLVVSVQVGQSKPRSSQTPPAVTNVQLSTEYDGSVVVNGDITNEATKNLSTYTDIDAVYFNKAGKIIGGSHAFGLSLALPPGAHTAFAIGSLGPVGVPQASDVAQAKVSVAPDYGSH